MTKTQDTKRALTPAEIVMVAGGAGRAGTGTIRVPAYGGGTRGFGGGRYGGDAA